MKLIVFSSMPNGTYLPMPLVSFQYYVNKVVFTFSSAVFLIVSFHCRMNVVYCIKYVVFVFKRRYASFGLCFEKNFFFSVQMHQLLEKEKCDCPRDCEFRQYRFDSVLGNMDAIPYSVTTEYM